jgi:2'-5' RNA ligase
MFFAIVPDGAACGALDALARELAPETGGRPTPAANLHLTLAFLGTMPEDRRARIEAAARAAAAATAQFDIALDSVGHFRAARVAWAGQAHTQQPLQHLFDRLRAGLAAAALPVEQRPFHPHVTLVRHCRHPPSGAPWPGTRWRAEALTLMASETLSGGARYRALASWPFGRPAVSDVVA